MEWIFIPWILPTDIVVEPLRGSQITLKNFDFLKLMCSKIGTIH